MSSLPAEPVSPAEFFETIVPELLATATAPDDAPRVDFAVGIALTGEGGGHWHLEVNGEQASIRAGEPEDAVATLVISVDDWRGALWEGEAGLLGERVREVFTSGRLPTPDDLDEAPPQLTAVTLAQLRSLDGAVRVAVVDETSGADPTDLWSLDLRIGGGALDGAPSVTVRVTSADLAAIESGEIDAFQAVLGGRIAFDGDMAFLLQLQAIALQAAAAGRR